MRKKGIIFFREMIRSNIIEDYQNSKNIAEFLSRKPRETPSVPSKVDGELEARIIALACGEPPEGRARWTIRRLASNAVELDFVDSLSPTTVYRILKKRNISLIQIKCGVFLPNRMPNLSHIWICVNF